MMDPWISKCSSIKGVLLDISGVLYDSTSSGGVAIAGSVDAVRRLKEHNIPVRFCTNETQHTKAHMAERLNKLGFDLTAKQIFPPVPAACQIMKDRGLRPHLLVHPGVIEDFADVDQENPNCVVMGDAAQAFSYDNVNQAFQVLMAMEAPVLFSMGRGKYYKEEGGLQLDVGAYMKALEYACGIEAEVVGKPSKSFFLSAVRDMDIEPQQALMVGDDVVNDVGGAQQAGLSLGLLVRTGKYRPSDERHPDVRPDGVVDNLAEAVDLFLAHRSQ